MGRSAELKTGLKVDFSAILSILGGVNGSQIANFDQKMGVSKAIFAFQRPPRALKMPKSYLESSAEFKNGLKVEIGPKLSILEPFYEPVRQYRPRPRSPADSNLRSICSATTLPLGFIGTAIVRRPSLVPGRLGDRSYFRKIKKNSASSGQIVTYDIPKCWKLNFRRSRAIKKVLFGGKLKFNFFPP